MGGGKLVYWRVEARPVEDQNARRDEGSKHGREQVRVRFWRGRRSDRRGWERSTGPGRDPPVGESRSAGHLDRRAQARPPVAAQGDVEALERRQYAHRLLPRVRVRRFDVQHGLRLPAHWWGIRVRGRLAEHQGDNELAPVDAGEGVSRRRPLLRYSLEARDEERKIRRQGLSQ